MPLGLKAKVFRCVFSQLPLQTGHCHVTLVLPIKTFPLGTQSKDRQTDSAQWVQQQLRENGLCHLVLVDQD